MEVVLSASLTIIVILVSVVSIYATWANSVIAQAYTTEANKTMSLQRFETTFFHLLQSQSEIVKGMDLKSKTDPTKTVAVGRDCFKSFYRKLKIKIKKKKESKIRADNPLAAFTQSDLDKTDLEFEEELSTYMNVYKNHQGDLGHYFRNLYHIFRFVNETKFIESKEKYTRLVRAQLSSYELVILFYNGLGEQGVDKFKPLIEDFHLLKNMDYDLLIDISHKEKYKPSAFESQMSGTKI